MSRSLGFTLIELVITIMILSILAISVIPKIVDFSKDARIAMVKSEATALKSGVSLARQKWRLLGSPGSKDARDDVQLWGTGTSGQVDFNIEGWPAQSYSLGDSVLTTDGPDDCLSVYSVLVQDGDAKAGLSEDAQFIVTKPVACTYTLVADPTLSFTYQPLTGEVNFVEN